MKLKESDLTSLEELEKRCWELLFRGAKDRNSGFRIFILSTVTSDGFPEARNVVLRDVHIDNKTVCFHTDYRSQKINAFKENPVAALTFWDKSTSLQIRLNAEVTINHKNEKSAAILQEVSKKEISLYKSTIRPGEELEKSEKEVEINEKEVEIPENFCWIECNVLKMDVLHLASTHTRAKYDYRKGNKSFVKA